MSLSNTSSNLIPSPCKWIPPLALFFVTCMLCSRILWRSSLIAMPSSRRKWMRKAALNIECTLWAETKMDWPIGTFWWVLTSEFTVAKFPGISSTFEWHFLTSEFSVLKFISLIFEWEGSNKHRVNLWGRVKIGWITVTYWWLDYYIRVQNK